MRIVAFAGLVAAALAALLVVALLLGRGVGSGREGAEPVADEGPVEPIETQTAIEVRVLARTDAQVLGTPIVDGLPSPAVLRLRVVGFDEFETATAQQCRDATNATRCGNRIPVQFDRHGVAEFQFLVRDDAGVTDETHGRCGVDDPPCLVTITSRDRRQHAEIQTVFGDRLPAAGTAAVEPSRGLDGGQRVAVEVTGLPARQRLTVTTCVAPGINDHRRCGAPAPVAEVVVGEDGTARTHLTVTRGPVGAQRLPCDDDHACAVVVIGGRADVRVAPVPIAFGAMPGAVYDPGRLGAGLAIAILLAAVTLGLVRRTDWSAVGEAAAPEIDDAEYADLDAIIAALPDEDVESVHP